MTPLIQNSPTEFNGAVAPFPVEKLTENILALSDAAVLISTGKAIDFCTRSIVSVLGIRPELVMRDGWDSLVERMHPADSRLLKNKLIPEIRRHLKNLTEEERCNRTFSFTARMRVPENQYALIAIESKPLKSITKRGTSTYVSIIRDISSFGNKAEMLLNIYEEESDENVLQRHYSFASENFSGREAEIIRHIAKGLTSNQIGDALSISPQTVRNHRKKIMRKASCNSSAALISLASEQGIV